MSSPTMLAISARLTLNVHDLNNEGAEGNQTQTRMVHVVDKDGKLAMVNAVSGDMLKHIQVGYLQRLAIEEQLPLCEGCRLFDANRINRDTEFLDSLGEEKDTGRIVQQVISKCVIDDAEGVLITAGKRSAPRKSTVEFGWLVGVPEKTQTESYFHVKYDPGRGEGSGDSSGANLGQNIFYRPVNSGIYAFVATFEVGRVGFNDVTREYVVDEKERLARIAAVLKSIAYTLVRTEGAQRNTQHPHVLDAQGVVTVSYDARPAPTWSPLQEDYREELTKLCSEINRLGGKQDLQFMEFDSLSEFASVTADILSALT